MKQNLRTRLIVTLLTLLAVGLTIMGFATVFGTKYYLNTKTDEQLISSMNHAIPMLESTNSPVMSLSANGPNAMASNAPQPGPPIIAGQDPNERHEGPPPLMEPQTARISSSGVVERQSMTPFGTSFEYSDIPSTVLASANAGQVHFSTESNEQDYRGIAFPLQNTQDVGVVVVPTGDTTATLQRLSVILLGIGLGIFALAALLAWRLVSLGLKPLNHMAEVTEAIADGSTAERVIPAQDAEMARLGNSINRAFDTRDASEQRLRSFIADASHELRTPLTSIRGYAELINSGAAASPEKLDKASERIENEASRLGVMVQDLLTLARLDEGKSLDITTFNTVPAIHDVIADAKVIDPERQVSYIGPDSFKVHADEAAVRQILTNLLANVRSHTPAGTPAEISCTSSNGPAVISVRDYGKGLTKTEQEKMFNRFWRQNPSKRSASETQSGSGLGLAIVQGLVEAQDGRLEAVTPPDGRGLAINMYLPLA